MTILSDKMKCCGCGACVQRCPKSCIRLQSDNEGFSYPQVNNDECIECGLCKQVCPVANPYKEHTPLRVLAAINNDIKVRMQSSSGGVFSILAAKVIKDGGVVFGARFDDSWQVVIDYAETLDGVASFRGSKYVQASTGIAYIQCEKFLKEGRAVLFSGTPCQVAGLKHFLKKEYENLITVDFICHGAPSPLVWKMYLKEVCQRFQVDYPGMPIIKDISFRDKSSGWKSFRFVLSFETRSREINQSFHDNSYMKAFLGNIILRPSCYACSVLNGKSCSDITIADYWGVQQRHPEFNDDKGTSLVFLNSSFGIDFFPFDDTIYVDSYYDGLVSLNEGLREVIEVPRNRDEFFEELPNVDDLSGYIDKIVRPPLYIRMKDLIIEMLIRIVHFFRYR